MIRPRTRIFGVLRRFRKSFRFTHGQISPSIAARCIQAIELFFRKYEQQGSLRKRTHRALVNAVYHINLPLSFTSPPLNLVNLPTSFPITTTTNVINHDAAAQQSLAQTRQNSHAKMQFLAVQSDNTLQPYVQKQQQERSSSLRRKVQPSLKENQQKNRLVLPVFNDKVAVATFWSLVFPQLRAQGRKNDSSKPILAHKPLHLSVVRAQEGGPHCSRAQDLTRQATSVPIKARESHLLRPEHRSLRRIELLSVSRRTQIEHLRTERRRVLPVETIYRRATNNEPSPPAKHRPREQKNVLPAIDIANLSKEVVRRINKQVRIERERHGRM